MRKKIIYTLFLAAFGAAALFMSNSGGRAGQAPSGFGNTGAPGDSQAGGNAQVCASCHGAGTTIRVAMTVELLELGTSNVVTSYVPGQQYTIRATIAPTTGTPVRYGVQVVGLKPNNTEHRGFSSPSTNAKLTIANSTGRQYLEHNGLSSSGVFTATWTAPASGTGTITFYGAGIGANNNGNDNGDGSGRTTLVVTEGTGTSTEEAQALAVNIGPNPASSTLNINISKVLGATASVGIFDLAGHEVIRIENNQADRLSADVSQLNAGIYFVRVIDGNDRVTTPFVKQ